MDLKSSISSVFLHAGKHLKPSPDIMLHTVPLLLTGNKEIIRRVEELFKLSDSLEAKYQMAMERVKKIEQSVLAKAFRGELAPQNPNDEPAEELLKRILAEKAKLESVKKKPKRSKNRLMKK